MRGASAGFAGFCYLNLPAREFVILPVSLSSLPPLFTILPGVWGFKASGLQGFWDQEFSPLRYIQQASWLVFSLCQ